MKSRFVLSCLLVLGLYLIVSLSRDVWHLVQKETEIKKSQFQLSQQMATNWQLKQRLEEVQSPKFVEQEAREKLGLAKEGETVYVLPGSLGKLQTGLGEVEQEKDLPNWRKWWNLFFEREWRGRDSFSADNWVAYREESWYNTNITCGVV